MSTTQLLLIRHGETIWNIQGRLQGHLDSDLTETGIAQAHAMAERLTKESFSALYSSDLGRAYRTAEIIAARTGHTILPDRRLRERYLGIFETFTWQEIEGKYPEELNAYRTLGPDYVIPNGESARQRFDRAIAGLEEIARRHAGQSVVIVTHGGVLNFLFRYALGIPLEEPRRFKLWNVSLNTFLYEDGKWILGSWGDISHLTHVGTVDDM